jgi:hypothetical protein
MKHGCARPTVDGDAPPRFDQKRSETANECLESAVVARIPACSDYGYRRSAHDAPASLSAWHPVERGLSIRLSLRILSTRPPDHKRSLSNPLPGRNLRLLCFNIVNCNAG